MAEPHDGTAADRALDRFWDGIAGAPRLAPDPPNLDPADAAAVRRFHALPDAPPPAPSFVTRLEEELMRPHVIPTVAQPTQLRATNGATTAARPLPAPPPVRRPSPRRLWWRALEGLAAAVLVLAIAAGLATGWGLLPNRDGRKGTTPPAIGYATPGPAVIDGTAMFLGNAARTGEVAGPGPSAEPDERWRVPITAGEANVTPSAPVAFDGLVYVSAVVTPLTAAGGNVGYVIATDAATGTERWRTKLFDSSGAAYPEVSPAAIADGLLFVGVSIVRQAEPPSARSGGGRGVSVPAGALVALDSRTGVERWRAATGRSGSSAPAVIDGVVYVGAEDGSVHALDAASGRERWRWPFETPRGDRPRLGGVISPAIAGDLVYVLDGASTLYALDGRTGEERWRFAPEGRIWGQPIVVGETAFVGSTWFPDESQEASTGRIYALDATTGTERWRHDYDEGNNVDFHVAGGGGTVYVAGVGDDDREVLALDAGSGRERWRVGFDGTVEVAPVLVGDAVYVASGDNGLFGSGQTWLGAGTNVDALDAASGERRWRVELGVGPAFVPAVDDGAVYGVTLPGYGGRGAFLTAFGSND